MFLLIFKNGTFLISYKEEGSDTEDADNCAGLLACTMQQNTLQRCKDNTPSDDLTSHDIVPTLL